MRSMYGPTVAVLALSALTFACSTPPVQPRQTTTTLPTASGTPVVIAEPGGARGPVVVDQSRTPGQAAVVADPSAAARGQVNHQVSGRVTDINRNSGQITIRTPEGGSMKLILPPLAVASIREGDDVAVSVLVAPSGSGVQTR
jgi:hypothetical protein